MITSKIAASYPVIRALIFDLDNCLASAREIGTDLATPVFDAIRRANRGTVAAEMLDRAFDDVWRHPFDWVVAQYRFSAQMRAAGWNAFRTMKVMAPMHGYGDLHVLSELPVARFLVTSGFRCLQESKIAALGIADLFTAIHVDAIDEPDRSGKRTIFARILDAHRWSSQQVLVVGDSAESEIAAGNELGIRTVQTLRPGVPRADNATFHVRTLAELADLLRTIGE
jgi:FMN phosphatase YigB (HAD superfamily)